ncbi:hypothetical protein BGZ61DRAFT_480122 [Ilyonectria robusta]|uniref:uncharacterized protein n=1 Tax=Ilyonectria robusta TaxID=1079257 RepID=UPI001E8DD68C|nr:uncharacterized protein BGZ61DRAFT_480122 [Ilyonectria robusta]KAH8683833.1 hypothetical protein BGZ61DRAFT_480122 [Ilyonectria robusta]
MPYVSIESDSPLLLIESWLNSLIPPTTCDLELDHHSPDFRYLAMSTPESSPRKRLRTRLQTISPSNDPMDTETREQGKGLVDAFGAQSLASQMVEGDEVEEEEEEEETPRSSRQTLAHRSGSRHQHSFHRAYGMPTLTSATGSPQPRRARSDMPSLSPARSESSTSTNKTTTTTSTTSRRQKSPVKSTADLHLAAKPFEYNDEAQLPPILEGLRDIRDHMNIVPAIIKDEVQKAMSSNEILRPWMIDHAHVLNQQEALQELDEIRLILNESRYCQREGASEAAWNDGVTSRILFLALRSSRGVRHHNITTARPESCLVPKDLGGDHFDGKLVDYSINLATHYDDGRGQSDFTSDKEAMSDDGLEDAIRKLLSHVPSKRKTINQTCYGPVRFNPAAVSIETKASAASDGRVQLSVWIAAWMEQMRYLRAVARNQTCSKFGDVSERPPHPVELPMPLVVASGSLWKLHLATDTTSKIIISSLFAIGDTSSLLGIYCLVKSLRILAAWADGPFRKFMREEIMGLPATSDG